jgi:hypothetical protein
VVETPQPNLVPGMKWLLGTFTMRCNRRHGLSGRLFAGRYKALLVDGSGKGYLKTVCDYVHLNPARANVLEPEERLSSYAWSSFGAYLAAPRKRPPGRGWIASWANTACVATARPGGGSLKSDWNGVVRVD